VSRRRLLDLLLSRKLIDDERVARSLIMQGRVLVDGEVVTGPGKVVSEAAEVELVEPECPYVSRGALKLKHCLDALGDDAPEIGGAICLDIGSATGGFSEVLLEYGAAKVYAVDVGKGLLDGRLRGDKRIVLLEGVNARHLSAKHVPEPCGIFTVDVSFISGVALCRAVTPLLAERAEGLLLLKPQFERQPDPEDERKGWFANGVVRHPALHKRVLLRAYSQLTADGFGVQRALLAEPAGAKGNREFFLHLSRASPGLPATDFASGIDAILETA
jgi:23S rRNA (cytidine1920-2'-O)/16S rRNA (cytidine1409-2'-O)-methyltransferase